MQSAHADGAEGADATRQPAPHRQRRANPLQARQILNQEAIAEGARGPSELAVEPHLGQVDPGGGVAAGIVASGAPMSQPPPRAR